MKATEVRIGNLVYGYFNPQDVGNPTTAPVDKVKAKDLELGDSFGVWFTPIPLTEEWLIKFGFKKVFACYKKGVLEMVYIFEYDNYLCYIGEDGNTEYKIEHVHQLQNLYFALTGEELTYNQ